MFICNDVWVFLVLSMHGYTCSTLLTYIQQIVGEYVLFPVFALLISVETHCLLRISSLSLAFLLTDSLLFLHRRFCSEEWEHLPSPGVDVHLTGDALRSHGCRVHLHRPGHHHRLRPLSQSQEDQNPVSHFFRNVVAEALLERVVVVASYLFICLYIYLFNYLSIYLFNY